MALLALVVSGCAAHEASPSFLPLFMADPLPTELSASTPGEEQPTLPAPRPVEPADKTAADEAPAERLPPPRVLTGTSLDEVIYACLNADPKIRAGFENINQAQADFLTSSLPPNPQLLGDGIFLPFRKFTPERPGGPPQTDWNLSWPIDWFIFGKRAAAMTSAALGVDVSVADFADLVRTRVAAAIAAYFDVLEADAMLELAREDLANLRRLEAIIRERVKLGGVGTIELDRSRLALLDSQREVRNRERTLVTARAALRSLMGLQHGDPNFRIGGTLEVPIPQKPLPSEEALALAEENRPDLVSLRRQIAKSEADINTEQHKCWPTVTPAAALSRQFQRSQGSPDAPSYDVSLTVSLPIFDRNQGNVAKAQATRAQVGYNYHAQLVALRAEIEQAVAEFQTAYTNVTTDDPEQLRNAKSVRDRIEAAYQAGGRPLIEVLDAERAYRETRRLYIMGQSTYWHSLYKLNAAVGKQVLR